jgi:Xaa-Pro aminopeptidase
MARRKRRKVGGVYRRRLRGLIEAMAAKRLPALLVTNRSDQIYLTGFTGEDGGVLVMPKRVVLLTDSRFDEQADKETPWADKALRKKTFFDLVGQVVRKLRLRTIGFQPESLTVEQLQAIRKAARPARLKPAGGLVGKLRITKDAEEVQRIRRSARVAEEAFRAMLRRLRVGMTETQLAATLEYEMKVRGASGPSFPTIVAEGPNASLPHAQPGGRKVRRGSAVLFDWGAVVDHYCSDLTRVIFVGRIPPRIRKIYDIVLKAQQAGIESVKSGQSRKATDAAARRVITKAGYGKRFGHGTGHGLGLDIHEAPSVNRIATGKLEPGMVITIEPGIYLPGVGGVRIEDDVLVTKDGYEVLTNLTKDITSLTV